MANTQDYYQILRVSQQATLAEIKKSFRRLARQYHPDLNPNNPEAEAEFKQICAAYEVLSDVTQRQRYDRERGTQSTAPESDEPIDNSPTVTELMQVALDKAAQRDYQGAIADFTRIIDLHPDYVQAYLQRAQVRLQAGDDRGVLVDCQQCLQLGIKTAQVYFLLGRARQRLSYAQAAIEAYSQAISIDDDYALAYYHRGQVMRELQEQQQALADWQTAAQLFRKQGDLNGYRLVQDSLQNLGIATNTRSHRRFGKQTSWVATWQLIPQLFLKPSSGLVRGFEQLPSTQAVWVGVQWGAIATLGFALAIGIANRKLPQTNIPLTAIPQLLIACSVPFTSWVGISAGVRWLTRAGGSWAGDLFVAGAALLPISIWALLSVVVDGLGAVGILSLSVFAICYSVVMLYSGCTRVNQLSESVAALMVPAMMLLGGWLFTMALSDLVQEVTVISKHIG
jgi:tetratricopeptide (TPR) repeat protein